MYSRSERSPKINGNSLWQQEARGPLAGVRVVDFGQFIAGPLSAMILADQGADVIRVDPPGGPRWNTPANAALLRGRRNLTLDLHERQDRARARALIASADVVIENFRPGVTERLDIGPADCARFAPHVVYCSLPGFGRDDPRATLAAWEGVVMAAAGAYSINSFDNTVSTSFSSLPLGSVFGALEGAMAIVAALIARDRDGVGQQVEVPLFDALFEASAGGGISGERLKREFVDFTPGWYTCSDGRKVNLVSFWFKHYEAFLRAAGLQGWLDDGIFNFDRFRTDPSASKELRSRLVEVFQTRTAREWEKLGQENGSCVAMARSMLEWMAEPHAVASGTLTETNDPVIGQARVAGTAVHISTSDGAIAVPRQLPGSHNERLLPLIDALIERTPYVTSEQVSERAAPPLSGIKVVDFSRVVAGPTAGRLLAQLGADVIKVDSSSSDHRAMAAFPLGHEYLNRGKRSADIDLKDPRNWTFAKTLLSQADVVIENFTVGVSQRLGIDAASARKSNPQLVYTYLNCYGRKGPWAGARGYAELANTATGVTKRSLGDRDLASGTNSMTLDLPRWFYTDYATGILGALGSLLALFERSRTGIGADVETSLVRATTLEQIIYIVDYDDRTIREPYGTERGWSPIQQLYDTNDGTIFVGCDKQKCEAMLQALDVPNLSEVGASIAARSVAEVEAILSVCDIGVHRVETMSEIMRPHGIADARGIRLEDEIDRFGKVSMIGPIARLSRSPLIAGNFVRSFGAETEEIKAQCMDVRRNRRTKNS